MTEEILKRLDRIERKLDALIHFLISEDEEWQEHLDIIGPFWEDIYGKNLVERLRGDKEKLLKLFLEDTQK